MRFKAVLTLGAMGVAGILAAGQEAKPSSEQPSADQIFDKYVQATGGKGAYEKVTTRHAKGTIDVTTYNVGGPFEQWAKAPNMMVNTSQIEGYGEVVQAYDGKAGWSNDPQAGIRDMEGNELASFQRSAVFNRALHMKEGYVKTSVAGKGKAGDREAWIVEANTAKGDVDKFFFDTETGLLLRSEVKGASDQIYIGTYENYKEINGIKSPMVIRQENPELSFTLTFAEITYNVPVEDSKFAKPAK